jgi:CRP/FNR family transcriptional regulator
MKAIFVSEVPRNTDSSVFLTEPAGEIISQWLADVYTLVMGKLTISQTLARLREVPLFSAMGQAELAGLVRACLVRNFQAGLQVFRPGQPAESFYVILAGKVKIFKTSAQGDEQILHLYGPGQTFGEAAMWAGIDYPAGAQTLSEATLLVVRRAALKVLLKKDPDLALAMMAGLAGKLREFNQLIAQLSLRDVPARTAEVLLQMAGLAGCDSFKLPQSKRQLAAQIGTVPETLSRALQKLKAANLIAVRGANITILDRPAMENLVR